MSLFIPFGPKQPKKPKAKGVAFLIDQIEVFGWIDSEADLTQGTEIFSVDENQNYCIPPDGFYSLLSGDAIEIINGVIQ